MEDKMDSETIASGTSLDPALKGLAAVDAQLGYNGLIIWTVFWAPIDAFYLMKLGS